MLIYVKSPVRETIAVDNFVGAKYIIWNVIIPQNKMR